MTSRCLVCNGVITPAPSASVGGKASDFIRPFDTHADCFIEKRNKETSNLMAGLVKRREEVEEAEAKKRSK